MNSSNLNNSTAAGVVGHKDIEHTWVHFQCSTEQQCVFTKMETHSHSHAPPAGTSVLVLFGDEAMFQSVVNTLFAILLEQTNQRFFLFIGKTSVWVIDMEGYVQVSFLFVVIEVDHSFVGHFHNMVWWRHLVALNSHFVIVEMLDFHCETN
eukprot:m.160594 g.160594  ORF g.160594 m.160594 type:complete len:151 (-) comp13385_c0_seq1:854-1306(-)